MTMLQYEARKYHHECNGEKHIACCTSKHKTYNDHFTVRDSDWCQYLQQCINRNDSL